MFLHGKEKEEASKGEAGFWEEEMSNIMVLLVLIKSSFFTENFKL